MIAEPLTLLQCTPIGDGASALVMTSSREARRFTTCPVKVAASVFAAGRSRKEAASAATLEVCASAARQAYEMAGVGPQDLDVVELHDCFTAHEVLAVEDLGLAPKGEGGRLAVEGVTALGGRIPVNPSGGLLSKGHPLGATGVAQVVELVWQLRGECGNRQVEGARLALAHNGGGIGGALELPAMSVTILSR
jgi:acetyl-CoA acetyltransferase